MLRELTILDNFGRRHTIPTDEHTKLFTFHPDAATVPNNVQIDAATANQLFGADGGGFVSADLVAYGMRQAEQMHAKLLELGSYTAEDGNGNVVTVPYTSQCKPVVAVTCMAGELAVHLCHAAAPGAKSCACGMLINNFELAAGKHRTFDLFGVVSWHVKPMFPFTAGMSTAVLDVGGANAFEYNSTTQFLKIGNEIISPFANACKIKLRGEHGDVVLHTDLSNAACAQCGAPEPFALLSEHRLDRKLKWCNGCSLSTLYCSKECQRKHWKVHKPVCKGSNRMLLMRGVAGTELVLAGGVLSIK